MIRFHLAPDALLFLALSFVAIGGVLVGAALRRPISSLVARLRSESGQAASELALALSLSLIALVGLYLFVGVLFTQLANAGNEVGSPPPSFTYSTSPPNPGDTSCDPATHWNSCLAGRPMVVEQFDAQP